MYFLTQAKTDIFLINYLYHECVASIKRLTFAICLSFPHFFEQLNHIHSSFLSSFLWNWYVFYHSLLSIDGLDFCIRLAPPLIFEFHLKDISNWSYYFLLIQFFSLVSQ